MRGGLVRSLVAMELLLVALGSPASAQVDLSTLLVGRWDGEVQMASGTYPRTLLIRSVEMKSDALVVQAEYGGQGNERGGFVPTIAPVAVAIEAYGSDVTLRFRTPESWPVELRLSKDRRHLLGDLRISADRAGVWAINPMGLAKTG